MLTARIRERVPSARAVGPARLIGHILQWHKRSVDGSGKCDIAKTGRNSDEVWGVLFEFDASEKPALDRAEGLGNGYAEKSVEVFTASGKVNALTYYATTTDSSLKPYHWYKAFVVAGAREHRLPEAYIGTIEAAPSAADADTDRAARNARVLNAG
jgi:hypothetical protein